MAQYKNTTLTLLCGQPKSSYACINSRARDFQITNNAVTSDEKEGDGIADLSDLLLPTGVNYDHYDEA